MPDALIDPVRYPEFPAGLAAGLVATGIGVVLWLRASGSPAQRPTLPVAGPLLGGAVLCGLLWRGLLSLALLGGLALLFAGAAAIRWRRHHDGPRGLEAAGLTIGLVAVAWLAWPQATAGTWVVAAGAGIGLVAALVGFERHSPHAGLTPLLVLLTAGGIYATVPDTEEARVLLAAALPLALLGWPRRLASLGVAGAVLLGGLLAWIVATGGAGRPGSVVGGFAAAGLLAADPVARRVAGATLLDRVPVGAAGGLGIATLHLGLVLVAARVAGLRDGAAEAAAVALPALAVVAVALMLGRRAA